LWTVVSSTGTQTTISNTATATVPAPTSGTTTVRLTVTDEANKQDFAEIVIGQTSATTAAPANAGSNACPAAIAVPQFSEVTVAPTDASASEPGTDTGTFTFTRTGDVSAALNVTIAMSGTANNGVDYQTIGANVAFAAGASTAVVTVTPIDNTAVNGSRTVIATLQSGATYDLGTSTIATVTIADNDTAAPPPSSSGGGGGGGGAMDWMTLVASLVSATLAGWRAARAGCGGVSVQRQRAARRSATSNQDFCARR
jgi:hypothetical protein